MENPKCQAGASLGLQSQARTEAGSRECDAAWCDRAGQAWDRPFGLNGEDLARHSLDDGTISAADGSFVAS